ncbi:MAG TPA: hypothetical protein VM029_22095 [Opitutaceae bacterium]|nr:hypothetical protein [Opitutaceae bacterium]
MRASLFTAFCLTAAAALADTPYSVDFSDLWFDPAESGWGINLAQQDNVAFATMFVYGPDGRPRWYSASNMNGVRAAATTPGVAFHGQLVEAMGPAQPGLFDAARVTRRDVGTIAFEPLTDNLADLSYTVDGVIVRKKVQRLTMKGSNASGEYVGYRSARGCGTANDPLSNNPASIRILQNPASFTMTSTVLNETCTYVGTPQQQGRISGAKGTFSCSGQTPPGQFEITNMNVTYQGFIARLTTRTSATCAMEARFVGLSPEGTLASRASVDASDLWWNANESGWGVNFQQQDDIAFATIFTYGPDGRPRWYSASDLRMRFVLPGGLPSFDGRLYESTGPGFSTAFNPAAVTRRDVGLFTATPVTGSPDEMNLLYYVDGVEYIKNVKRFTTRGNDPTGTYRGHYAMHNPCSGGGTGLFTNRVDFSISQSGGMFQMTASTSNQTCTFLGPLQMRGRMVYSQGNYICTGNAPENGTFRVSELEVGQHGIIGQILRGFEPVEVLPWARCTMAGRIAGVRPF